MEAGSGQLGPAMIQWTGRFRATQQATGDITAVVRNNATGTVTLTSPGPNQTHARISLSAPSITDQLRLQWAVVPGACRSGGIPILTVDQFPEFTISQGRGDLDETFSMPLPISGTYHVNIYNGDPQDEAGVFTCADLKVERRSN
jgi:hypothetical protein